MDRFFFVCVSGLWMDAAEHLIRSVNISNSIPEPDRKGISSGLQTLCNIFHHLTPRDYEDLLQKFVFHADRSLGPDRQTDHHPLLEAYNMNRHGAWLVRFDPFFYSKHQVRLYRGFLSEM